jgi:hypothetical protein
MTTPSNPGNANDSIRIDRKFDSNENDSHNEKHDESRSSISEGISIYDDVEKFRINL